MILRRVMEFRAKYRDVEQEWKLLEEDLMHLLNIGEVDIEIWAHKFYDEHGENYQFKDKIQWYFEQLKTFDLQRILDRLKSVIEPEAIKGEMLEDKRDGYFYVTIDTMLSVASVKEIVDKYYFSRFSGSFDDIEELAGGFKRMSLVFAPTGAY